MAGWPAPASFRYEYGVTPLTSLWIPCVTAVCFVGLVVFLSKYRTHWCRDSWNYSLLIPLALHNGLLCVVSVVMLVGFVTAAIRDATDRGLVSTLCRDTGGTLGGLWFWVYVFYLSKYWELFDTIFLILRGRTPSVLHLFHHAIVLPFFCFTLAADATNVWVPAAVNCTVHVWMYYYFACQALTTASVGKKGDSSEVTPMDRTMQHIATSWLSLLPFTEQVRWSQKFLTRAQIAQFYFDMFGLIILDLALPPCLRKVTAFARSNMGMGGISLAFIAAVPVCFILLWTRMYKNKYRGRTDHKND